VFRLNASLRLGHSSNLFHVARRHEAAFETDTAAYERFAGMEGPGDGEATLSLDLGWRFKHASKRAIEIRLRSRQHAYLDNEIANFSELGLDTRFDVTKKDALTLELDVVPKHFRKNYANEAFPGIRVFERADVRSTGWRLEHRRDWTKAWASKMAIGGGRRDVAAPFNARDADRSAWSVGARWKATKRLALELSHERRKASTPTRVELGVAKDRSHDDAVTTLDLTFNLRHQWRVSQTTVYQVRDYTTSVAADTSRHGRTDHRWVLGAEVRKGLKAGWELQFDVSRLDHRSGRETSSGSSRKYGYDDVGAGVTISYSK